ncbi:MAG: hypothetical protein KAJ17_08785, partial [Candidatus Krumholzibacteria bacterium]|nr:hypothetical protein [Candidatus Krumholzibacteria bacterium]
RSSSATAVEESGTSDVPGAAMLTILSLAPNPSNPSLKVSFETRRSGQVTMEIFDVRGRRVKTVPLGFAEPGRYWAHWEGRDASGDNASGLITASDTPGASHVPTRLPVENAWANGTIAALHIQKGLILL